jgi:hypothetical protein
MTEYQPVWSTSFSAIERPCCPTGDRSRMILSHVEPGRDGFDIRTFECQKCGYIKKMMASKDPMETAMPGWPDADPNSPA